MSVLLDVAVVLALVLIGALFVAGEIALVSLRESQVRALTHSGDRRAAKVAKLVRDPNRFLAATQIGVTLTALLSSAFGAVTLSERAADALRRAGLGDRLAGLLGFLGVTLVISFVSLVLGELAPKRLALQRAEGTATLFAPVLDRIATLTRPVVWLLSRCTNGVVRLLGGDPAARQKSISEEELRGLVAAHEALHPDERRLIDEVFAARERVLREVMTPRTEVVFLDASMSVARAVEETAHLPHSRYPVVRASYDDVVGFVHVRDLLAAGRARLPVGQLAREVTLLPASLNVLTALSQMRRKRHHLAIVVDEYGGTAGIVTLEDLLEEVVGDIRDEYDPAASAARRLRGGDVEVDGLLNLDEFEEATGIRLPEGPYETAAGYVMRTLGHLPAPGETVEADGARLTVVGLDGRRVSRLRVTRQPRQGVPASTGGGLGGAPPLV
ncbi:MAG TPA: hemolysin family protein [Frankiaceae bacterium]|nr:hemolysin family protein [Frankiaceae bacterium]